jgi:Arc/MetJ-type ribon-helix-helix transcriptional regulator
MSLSKVKLSITLDSDLVKWLDQKIKTKKFANRSHGLEFAVSQLKENE